MQGTQYAPRESILCMEHFVALQCSIKFKFGKDIFSSRDSVWRPNFGQNNSKYQCDLENKAKDTKIYSTLSHTYHSGVWTRFFKSKIHPSLERMKVVLKYS